MATHQQRIQSSPLNPRGVTEEHQEENAVLAAKQKLQFLDQLETPYFKTFWAQFGAGVLKQQERALDTSLTAEERERAVFVHEALKTWHDLPRKERDAAVAQIQAAEQRRRQKENAPPMAL